MQPLNNVVAPLLIVKGLDSLHSLAGSDVNSRAFEIMTTSKNFSGFAFEILLVFQDLKHPPIYVFHMGHTYA
jgi:hypothetical protein